MDLANRAPTYKDLRVNEPLCQQYVDDMALLGEKILVKDDESYTASTDMGEGPLVCMAGFPRLTDHRQCVI